MPRNAKTMLGWASQQPSSPEPPARVAPRAALPHQPSSQQAPASPLIRPRSRSRSPAPLKIYPRQTLLEAYPQQEPAHETHPQQVYPQRGFPQQAPQQQAYPRQALPQQGHSQLASSRQPPRASRVPHAPPLYRESPLAGMSAGNPPAARRSYLQLMAICDRSPVPVTVPRAPNVRAGTAGDDLDEDLDAIGAGAHARWTRPIYLLGALVLFAGLECLLMASGALSPIAATVVSLAAPALLLLWPAIRAWRQAPAPVVEAADQHDTEEMPFAPGAFDPDLDQAFGSDPEDGADADLSASREPDSSADENASPRSSSSSISIDDGCGVNVEVGPFPDVEPDAEPDASIDAKVGTGTQGSANAGADPKAKADPSADPDAGISVDIRADDAALDPKADAGASAAAHLGASTDASTRASAGARASAHQGASTQRAVAARARG